MPAPAYQGCDATRVVMPDGRSVLSFGGCNYLGLANHPAVAEAVRRGVERYGLSASASRETTGNAAPHEALEHDLEGFLQVERALLVPDGYLANIVACQGLAALGVRRAVLDERAHRSLADAAATAGLVVERFAHRKPESLAAVLRRTPAGRAVVMTDGVFTVDGAPAPLEGLVRALRTDDVLLVDDCHGLGVVGDGGRGSVAAAGLSDPRIVVTSSLAKGLGGAGGVVAGRAEVVAACAGASAYVCTTPIAPAMAEGTRAGLRVLAEEPERLGRLTRSAGRLREGLARLGLIGGQEGWGTPVAAFSWGDVAGMRRVCTGMLEDGFRLSLQRYPGSQWDAYFRLSVNAEHSDAQIDAVLDALARRLAREGVVRSRAASTSSVVAG